MKQPHKPAVRFIFVTLLLDVLGFGLLIPVGPRLVQELQGEGASPETAAVPYGLLAVTFAVMQFFFAPVLGSLSDRFGRRPVILLSLLGSGLDFIAQALAPNLWVLFLTRALNGVSGSNITVCNAYIADVTPPEKRAAGFGMIGAAFGIGFVFGPLMGGGIYAGAVWLGTHAAELPEWSRGLAEFAGTHAVRLPFFAAAALCLVNWAYGCFVLPESLAPENRRAFSLKGAHPIAATRHMARYPVVLGLGAALFLMNIAQFGLHVTWALYTQYRYHWEPWEVALSLTLVGVGAAVVQGGLARKIIPAMGEPRSVIVGIAIGIAAFAAYGLATRGWMIYALVLVASLGGIAGPAIQSIITRAVRPDEQGEVQGALTSFNSGLAAILGPAIAAPMFKYFISTDAPMHLPGAPYLWGSFLCVIGLVLTARVLNRHADAIRPPASPGAGPAPSPAPREPG
ncbi:MAG: TCR/Tet family MFS transporter [Planctomycetes bacterium]|nr:TCR/Tet family MFS transporter [Planctomycetota bacterium]